MLYTDSGSPIPNDKPMEQDNRKWITDRTPVASEANFYDNVEVPASSRSSEPITSSGRRFTKFYMIKQGEPWLPASIEYYKDRQALVAEGYEQGLAAGRAEQQATTEATTDSEPEPGDFQTLHGIALDMVDSLRPIVIPEILNVLRRAIREPMAQQQAAAEATPEPSPSQSDGWLIAALVGIGLDGKTARRVLLIVARWLAQRCSSPDGKESRWLIDSILQILHEEANR